jgi:uncharacterized protein with von Willebrand factor type A (vWA) domain
MTAGPDASGETLAANVVHFVRLLRRAGLGLGPGDALEAERAVAAVDILRRDEFYWALHAVLVRHRADHQLFDEAFTLFWRIPSGAGSPLALLMPWMKTPTSRTISRRLSEAWRPPEPAVPRASGPERPPEVDTFLAYSPDEIVRRRDFDQMSAEELAQARVLVGRLDAQLPKLRTRRTAAATHGRHIDPARTVREALRRGGEVVRLRWKQPVERPPKIVALCDISGSMGRYSEMLLRFFHALMAHRRGGHVFLFATRLSNVTRALRQRDVDRALAMLGRSVSDWASGTRLGACLRAFNLVWSRRVLAQGAIVLLVTDGLDRDDTRVLHQESARLRRSCRRLIWLNPLLRYAGFEPRAAGIQALLANVDEHRPVHNLDSLDALARALAGPWRR